MMKKKESRACGERVEGGRAKMLSLTRHQEKERTTSHALTAALSSHFSALFKGMRKSVKIKE